jgi:hypothetical protein
MYMSEEKRAVIRKCFENSRSNSGLNPEEKIENRIKGFHDTEAVWKMSQILFDARDGTYQVNL